MTIINLPVTTYSVRESRPTHKFGSPARLPIFNNLSRIYARVPIDRVPMGATISNAILRFTSHTTPGGSRMVRVLPITSAWNSSITWNKQPTVGAVLFTTTATNPTAWDLDVTSWAQTRSRRGLRVDTTGAGHYLRGSSAARGKPVLVVTYSVGSTKSGGLVPDGGSVSVAQPILTYAGDDDMTQQKIEFSLDGITPSASTAWLPASDGRFDASMAPGVQPVLVNGGAGIYWRITTDGPAGPSSPSAWAYYEYDALPTVAFTNPPASTPDGSPTLQWTATSQQAWKATLYGPNGALDSTGWKNDPVTRDWTPSSGVQVPGGAGRFELWVRDAVTPRVIATDAPIEQHMAREFVTSLAGVAVAIDSLVLSWDDPIPRLSGTRSTGIPDEVMLVRDGVAVPLWDDDGIAYRDWAPAADFFTGNNFSIPDYTSDPRQSHTWSVRTRILPSTISSVGPTVTSSPSTASVWLVDPRTDARVEVLGWDDRPAVEQSTEEQAILHIPINGGLKVEPKRRRLTRSTRSGSVSGVVLNEHEDTLLAWVEGDSGVKYRLIFGKVNWPVIIGDYSPTDVFYSDACGPDRVLVALNWWQRLSDI